MSLTGPTQDVFDLVLARPVTTEAGEHEALIHLAWLAPQQGNCLVQVYLDDELVDVSIDTTQRDMWLMCDRSRAGRIELLAVPASDPDLIWRAMPEHLSSWSPPLEPTAAVTLIRDEQLPVDTQLTVSIDGEATDRGAMWPADESRSGFGALFGLNGFGHDAITGPGLGRGELGMGPLGTDGRSWSWRRADVPTGTHDLLISATGEGGQAVGISLEVEDVVIDRLPSPADTLDVDANFTLSWTA